MKNRLAYIIATAFYIGRLPGAKGTYAAVATTLTYFLCHHVTHRIRPELHLSLVCIIIAIGVLAADNVSRQTGQEDPSIVVIDEVAGQLLTFLFLPVNLINLCLGTFFFRVFDIWKPLLIGRSESLKRGVGIMADDVLAGCYSNLLLQLLGWWLAGTIPFSILRANG
jgi:phosphatidylglycerophosphatase A